MKAKPQDDRTRVLLAIWRPKIEAIQNIMADYYKVSIHGMQQHSGFKTSVKARQAVHYFSREFMPHCPMNIIGLVTGNGKPFDHSSISHSYKKIKELSELKNLSGLPIYPVLVNEIAELRRLIAAKFDRKKTARRYRIRCHYRDLFKRATRVKLIEYK